jgi:hypothetical protein
MLVKRGRHEAAAGLTEHRCTPRVGLHMENIWKRKKGALCWIEARDRKDTKARQASIESHGRSTERRTHGSNRALGSRVAIPAGKHRV